MIQFIREFLCAHCYEYFDEVECRKCGKKGSEAIKKA